MEELKKKMAENAAITEEQAAIAITTMADYIKARVPHIVHQQLDKIIGGMTLEDTIRNQVEDLGSEVKERAGSLAKDLKIAFENAFRSKKTE